MVLSSEIIGVIVGGALAIVAIVSGTLITYVIKLRDEKKIEKNAIRALLAEVYVNQKLLKTNVALIKNLSTFTGSLSEIAFLRDIYSVYFRDKIGLLDPKCGEKVIHYYAFLGEDFLETLDTLTGGLLSIPEKSELFLKKLGDAYKLGEELIECLNATRSKFLWFFVKSKVSNAYGLLKLFGERGKK